MSSFKGETFRGQFSWKFESEFVTGWVTRAGGQLGPVEFRLPTGKTVQPFHVAPWAEEAAASELPPILAALRGDFFCMPFGANPDAWNGEKHPLHGETANLDWSLVEVSPAGIALSLETTVRPGKVTKSVSQVPGCAAIRVSHRLEGFEGPMCVGNHAMLHFGSEARISTSPFIHGMVYPGEFENPVEGGYTSLKPGATFASLSAVPMANGGGADLSRYPAREGFEDLVMVTADPSVELAWNAAVVDGEHIWLALRSPKTFASSVLWHSNGGRHYAPWNGRHRGVLGIEDVTAHFHEGLKKSVEPNELSAKGIPTSILLSPEAPTELTVVYAVLPCPPGFGAVSSIVDGAVVGSSGARVALPDGLVGALA